MRPGTVSRMLNSKSKLTWVLAVSTTAMVACASETGAELAPTRAANVEALELALPEHGFQVETAGMQIEPGDDIRMCEVVVLPGESTEHYYVNRIQSVLAGRGEDLVVRAADPGSETAAIMDPGASMPCTRAGEAFGEELRDVLRNRGRYADERFPLGAGKLFQGGQKLAVEYHYVNDSKDVTLAKAKLSFHVVTADKVQHLVRTASFDNFTIYTPPNGQSSHLAECRFHEELMVSDLVRRTQRYGTDFKVWIAGGERDGTLVWESLDRRESRKSLTVPLHLLPGEGFRFQCDYENPTDHELRYGVSAADETCTLDAIYWSAEHEGEEPEAAVAQDCLLFNVDDDGIARPRL
jgi:hypothetical protein